MMEKSTKTNRFWICIWRARCALFVQKKSHFYVTQDENSACVESLPKQCDTVCWHSVSSLVQWPPRRYFIISKNSYFVRLRHDSVKRRHRASNKEEKESETTRLAVRSKLPCGFFFTWLSCFLHSVCFACFFSLSLETAQRFMAYE